MIDTSESLDSSGNVLKVDLSNFILPMVFPNDQEILAHEQVLCDIDKASGGKTLWRNIAV